MDDFEIARRRLHNLRLAAASSASPEDVVSWLGAVQSQDYGPAKWSVAARAGGIDDKAMDQAVAKGSILRTHVLRPTWHFVSPQDIRWMLELTAPRIQARNAHRYRQLDLDEAVLKRSDAVIIKALEGDNQLTRKELQAVLEAEGVVTEGQRMPYLLMNAELNAVICSGARKGKQHTYALLDERSPQQTRFTEDEALAELTLRYFTSHGPATAKDFQWWSSLTLSTIRKGIELVGPQLSTEVTDGVTYLSSPAADPPYTPSPTVHLLQTYDEYIVGYRESRHVLDATGIARARGEKDIFFNSAVLLDGQLVGRWKRHLKKSEVVVEVLLYTALDDAQMEALRAAVDDLGKFLDLTATLMGI